MRLDGLPAAAFSVVPAEPSSTKTGTLGQDAKRFFPVEGVINFCEDATGADGALLGSAFVGHDGKDTT